MFSGISVAMLQGKTGYLVVLFSLLLLGSILLSLSMGYMEIPVLDIVNIVLGMPSSHPENSPVTETFKAVLLDIRLPRILTCASVGGALTVSGVLFQGFFSIPWPTLIPWACLRARLLAPASPFF